MSLDPVAFFFAHAARHLATGPHKDAWTGAAAVFDRAYACAMPMREYARKTIEQARRAGPSNRRRMLRDLARYRVVDELVWGGFANTTAKERQMLRTFRDAWRAKEPARERPAKRRPAPDSVVVARLARAPLTIANVQWASGHVEQRWLHEDNLASLIGRLAAQPTNEPLVIAVAGPRRFSPATLAFSAPRRLAICFPDRTEHLDPVRLRRLGALLAHVRPEPRAIGEFRRLCRARALTVDVDAIDRKLLHLADQWRIDVTELHDLLVPATDLELNALSARREA